MTLQPDDALVQRTLRRAWNLGETLYGWKQYEKDGEAYQSMKVIIMAILEQLTSTVEGPVIVAPNGPLVSDNLIPPLNTKVPNDTEPGVWP